MTNPKGRVKWNENLPKEVGEVLSDALVEITMLGERKAKEQLYPGHGVDTGTLKRSIHSASPDYSWPSDDVKPAPGTPERGGKKFTPKVIGKLLMGAFGSGLSYAIYPHQGHHTVSGYFYIRKTVPTMRSEAPKIVKKHANKRKV